MSGTVAAIAAMNAANVALIASHSSGASCVPADSAAVTFILWILGAAMAGVIVMMVWLFIDMWRNW